MHVRDSSNVASRSSQPSSLFGRLLFVAWFDKELIDRLYNRTGLISSYPMESFSICKDDIAPSPTTTQPTDSSNQRASSIPSVVNKEKEFVIGVKINSSEMKIKSPTACSSGTLPINKDTSYNPFTRIFISASCISMAATNMSSSASSANLRSRKTARFGGRILLLLLLSSSSRAMRRL